MRIFIHIRRLAFFVLITMTVLAMIGGGFWLVRHRRAALADAPRYGEQPVPVHVAVAQRGELEITRHYLAIVEPVRIARLTARVSGRVESIAIDEGSVVESGQPLIQLDDREVTHAIESAQSQVRQAQAELASSQATVNALVRTEAYLSREAERLKSLMPEGAASVSETENAVDRAAQAAGELMAARHRAAALERQIDVLTSQVQELKTRKSYHTISSPFDGIVSRREVDTGDMATPDKALVVVEHRSRMKLAFDVPQAEAPLLHAGMAVRFNASDETRHASVSHLFPSLDRARMQRAEAVVQADHAGVLDTGSYLPVTVVIETRSDVTLMPAAAIVESPASGPHVFVVDEGVLQAKPVVILGRNNDRVAVEGIEPGTEVVMSTFLGWSRLSAGLTVEATR